jgi:TolA-binding protein
MPAPHPARPWHTLALALLLGGLSPAAHAQAPAGYTRAVELIGAGKYQPAQVLLDSLLEHNTLPADLVDNGHYWLGEALYGQKAWLDAMLAFERCLAEPAANKAEAAQLKIGLCWYNEGRPERACREAQRLLQRWPRGEHTAQARRLVQLACGAATPAAGTETTAGGGH